MARASTVSGSTTRPADTTAYASGDLIANSTTAGSVVPVALTVPRLTGGGGSCRIKRMRLRKSGIGITTCTIRIHLYTASPTVANGDNGVWSTNKAADYLGAFDVTVDKAFTDGAFGVGAALVGTDVSFAATGDAFALYALLEARSAYTPANAEVFTISADVEQD